MQQLGVSAHDGKRIVEGVRDAAGKRPRLLRSLHERSAGGNGSVPALIEPRIVEHLLPEGRFIDDIGSFAYRNSLRRGARTGPPSPTSRRPLERHGLSRPALAFLGEAQKGERWPLMDVLFLGNYMLQR